MKKEDTIPDREKWLFENPEALSQVLTGIQEAADGKLSVYKPSDIDDLDDNE
ncbi:MAG: hypothetical protein DHS20C10_02000 [marine bacterium B5-7]|nr:MAG: hypothetical protein DHS20C10_02000 [marine bacterium B5-7]